MIDETRGDSTGQKPHDLLPDDATMIAEAKAELKRLDAHCLGANTIVLGRTLMALERAVDRIAELRSGSDAAGRERGATMSDDPRDSAVESQGADDEEAIGRDEIAETLVTMANSAEAQGVRVGAYFCRAAAVMLRRDAPMVEACEWARNRREVYVRQTEMPGEGTVFEACDMETYTRADGPSFEAAIIAAAAALRAESEVQGDE